MTSFIWRVESIDMQEQKDTVAGAWGEHKHMAVSEQEEVRQYDARQKS
jgi:hypothetical protein